MVFLTDHYVIFLDRIPSKLKLEKINGILIIILYVIRVLLNYIEFETTTTTTTTANSSASGWWGYTNSCFKENARTFSKNFTTQENITISTLKKNNGTSAKNNISNQKLNK